MMMIILRDVSGPVYGPSKSFLYLELCAIVYATSPLNSTVCLSLLPRSLLFPFLLFLVSRLPSFFVYISAPI